MSNVINLREKQGEKLHEEFMDEFFIDLENAQESAPGSWTISGLLELAEAEAKGTLHEKVKLWTALRAGLNCSV